MCKSTLHRYDAAVTAAEARLAAEAEELGEETIDPDELQLERLDAGLFSLQCAAVVLAALWETGDAGLRRRLLACLHQRGHSLQMPRCAGRSPRPAGLIALSSGLWYASM